jgi:alpha-tubulin suppressor-like RCC1 family protein
MRRLIDAWSADWTGRQTTASTGKTMTMFAVTTGLRKAAVKAASLLTAFILAVVPAAAQVIPTTMGITSSPNPSTFGQSVTLSATLETRGKPLPAGNVAFSRSGAALGAAALQAQGVTVARISATNALHTCAVSTAGRVWCWGFNASGQLGDGTTTTRDAPVLVAGITGATAVATSRSTTCALVTGGAVRCWGRGTSGQLGNGASADSLTPVAVTGITGATSLSGGTGHFCVIIAVGAARCWGEGAQGQLGNGFRLNRDIPVAVSGLSGATAITAADAHTCALVTGGAAKCWGSDTFGKLGDGPGGTTSAVPVNVANLTGATAISAGSEHTCALVAAGAVRCWGDGGSGQLGNGVASSSEVPVAASGVTGATGIASGGRHSCALFSGGTAKCWGRNFFGQLGDGGTTNQNSAVNVAVLSGATALTGGETHTCALLANGSVQCWGSDDAEELGYDFVIRDNDGSTINSFTNPSAVTVGFNHSCAIVAGGAVQCWGAGAFGRLGNGSTLGSIKPVTVMGLSGVTKIAAGFSHTCALLSNGTVKCWGNNFDGQIGNGESGEAADALTPATVLALSGATDIDAGGGHTCAIVAGGAVKCWGANEDGQLGNSSNDAATTPVDVTGVTGATKISTGSGHTCALIQPTGSLRCWGRGTEGQLQHAGGDFLHRSHRCRRRRLPHLRHRGAWQCCQLLGTRAGRTDRQWCGAECDEPDAGYLSHQRDIHHGRRGAQLRPVKLRNLLLGRGRRGPVGQWHQCQQHYTSENGFRYRSGAIGEPVGRRPHQLLCCQRTGDQMRGFQPVWTSRPERARHSR